MNEWKLCFKNSYLCLKHLITFKSRLNFKPNVENVLVLFLDLHEKLNSTATLSGWLPLYVNLLCANIRIFSRGKYC